MNMILAILHGSRVSGGANERSDWDVAVLADHILTFDERAELREAFAVKLHVTPEQVDIADLRAASPLLRYRAAMFGNLIEGDRRDLLLLQLAAWKDFLNNRKIFDLQSRFVEKAI